MINDNDFDQIDAENDVINESWDKEGNSNNLADSVGLMVYEGSQSLNYVKNFVNGADQWEGKNSSNIFWNKWGYL